MQKNTFFNLSLAIIFGFLAFFAAFLLEEWLIKSDFLTDPAFPSNALEALFFGALTEEILKIGLFFLLIKRFSPFERWPFLIGLPIGFGFLESYFSPENDFFKKPLLHLGFFIFGFFLTLKFKKKQLLQFFFWLILSLSLHFIFNLYKINLIF